MSQGIASRPDSVPMTGPPLPPQPKNWPVHSALWGCAGIVSCGVLLTQSQTGFAALSLLGGVSAAGITGALGARAYGRAELADRVTEAVCPRLGWRAPDRQMVKLSRWRGAGIGQPQRLRLRYGANCNGDDPAWLAVVIDTVALRLGGPYTVIAHNSRRCVLTLERSVCAEDGTELSEEQLRAGLIVHELLGSSASVEKWDLDGLAMSGFTVRHDIGTKLAASGYRRRVESVVSAMLPGRWRANWDLEADSVSFQLRPEIPRRVDHPVPEINDSTLYAIPMGIDENGNTVRWYLLAQPHQLITGRTGTGKTVVINTLVTECTYRGWPVWIIDPKRVEFMGLRGWPNVEVIATEIEAMVAVLLRAWDVMEERYRQVDVDGAIETDFEPLIVVLDELSDFMGMVKAWWATVKPKGAPAQCPVIEKFYSIARKGRTSNIHLIVGMQRPDVALLGSGDARDNFTSRMSLGRLSPDGARMMWEGAWPVATAIPTRIPGRGCAPHNDDPDIPVEVQGFWTPDPRRAVRAGNAADIALVDQLRPKSDDHPLKSVVFPDELMRPTDDEPQRVWEAVLAATLEPNLAGMVGLMDQPPARSAALTFAPDVVVDVADADDPSAYLGDEQSAAADIGAGDLVLVDDVSDRWSVVQSIEPSPLDEDQLLINVVDEDGFVESIECHGDSMFPVRKPAFGEFGEGGFDE